jgi:hypothetical protein
MRQWLRSHLTYANVMVTILAFLVLGGSSAVALSGSNTVFSDDIVDNEVKTGDVRNDTLTGGGLAAGDLRPNAVGTSELANNSLSGTDIDESTLGGVNAETVDGAKVCSGTVEFSGPETQNVQDVCTAGPFTLTAGFIPAFPTDSATYLRIYNSAEVPSTRIRV